jgi:hypothetical protein
VVGLFTGHCHLKGHLFKLGLTDYPICERCIEDESATHTHTMGLWGCSSYEISSPGPVFHGTKWLLWRPQIQSPTLHSRYGINKEFIKRGSTIDHWRSRCKGRIFCPILMHIYIHAHIAEITIEAAHSSGFSAERKNAWSETSAPSYIFMAWCLNKYWGNFSFISRYDMWLSSCWFCLFIFMFQFGYMTAYKKRTSTI